MSISMKRCTIEFCACLALLASSSPVFAHHIQDEEMPLTLASGLLSGLGHPIIGLDHFVFIVAVGIASESLSRGALPILPFVLATVAGCALHLHGVTIPMPEIGVAGSVLVVGAAIMFGHGLSLGAASLLFAMGGVFHGYAYGEGIFGAEQTPLAAYLVGFAGIQFVIAFSAMLVARAALPERVESGLPARLSGVAISGVGVTLLLQNTMSLVTSSAAPVG